MDIYFEQDGETPHTSQSNHFLIKKLFGDSFIQNPPKFSGPFKEFSKITTEAQFFLIISI